MKTPLVPGVVIDSLGVGSIFYFICVLNLIGAFGFFYFVLKGSENLEEKIL